MAWVALSCPSWGLSSLICLSPQLVWSNPMKQLLISLRALIILSILTGVIYPVLITVIGKVVFPAQANGSILTVRGRAVGSSLIGQSFADPKYFHSRPSASSYDASNSGGSNFALTNQKLLDQVTQRIQQIRSDNNLSATTP